MYFVLIFVIITNLVFIGIKYFIETTSGDGVKLLLNGIHISFNVLALVYTIYSYFSTNYIQQSQMQLQAQPPTQIPIQFVAQAQPATQIPIQQSIPPLEQAQSVIQDLVQGTKKGTPEALLNTVVNIAQKNPELVSSIVSGLSG